MTWCAKGKSATSGVPTSQAGSLPMRFGYLILLVIPGSFLHKIRTHYLIVTLSESWYRLLKILVWGFCRIMPLASGLLTGKYRRGHEAPEGSGLATRPQRLDDANFDNIEALESFADKRELKLLDVAIDGLAAQPGVSSVISGASTSDQVRRNVVAANWVPTAEDLAEIDEITQ